MSGVEQDARRRLALAGAAGAVAAFVVFAVVLLSDGRGLLPHDFYGNFYDLQARAWFHGRWNLPAGSIGIEAFIVHGRTYTYFGPVPSVLRIPVLLATSALDGRMTRISMLVAQAVALWALARLLLAGRSLVTGREPAARFEAVLAGVMVFGLGASMTVFLGAVPWVFHEAILWGVAIALWSAYFLVTYVLSGDTPSERSLLRLVAAGGFAIAALMTRPPVGAGAVAGVAVVALLDLVRALWTSRGERVLSDPRRPRAVLVHVGTAAAAVLAAVVIYAAVNQAKFGSLFHLPIEKQTVSQLSPHRLKVIHDNGGSSFSATYVPTNLAQAVRPDAFSWQRSFPFVNFPRWKPNVIGGADFDTIDWSSSLSAAAPLLSLLALLGVAAMVVPARLGLEDRTRRVLLVLVGMGAAVVTFATFDYLANRYLNDLYPPLALASVVGFWSLTALLGRVRVRRRSVKWLPASALVMAAVLALWGAWFNAGLGLEASRVLSPTEDGGVRAAWLRTQLDLTPGSGLPFDVRQEATLPGHPGPRDQALIVGRCDGLYLSNGDTWVDVEYGPDSAATLTVDGPVHSARTVLTTAHAPRRGLQVSLRPSGSHAVRAEIDSRSTGHSLRGTPVAVDPGRPLRLSVVLDPYTRLALVEINEKSSISTFSSRPGGSRLVAGTGVRLRPSRAPTCHALQRKLAQGAGASS